MAPQITGDTELACTRARGRTAAAWTQILFVTRTWRALARRADEGDTRAWKVIGDLIERNRRRRRGSSCTRRTLRKVRETAERLARAE